MPAPSILAQRLANDLVDIGKMFGFEAIREGPTYPGASHKVDVLWKIKFHEGAPFPEINVASIEIQHSYSPPSISHNIFKAEKTLHPAFHFVISYHKLSDEFKENLKLNFPCSGLKIIEGDEELRELNRWMTNIITNKTEEKKLEDTRKRIEKFAKNQSTNTNQSEIKAKFREKFQTEIEEVVTPKEVNNLIRVFANFEEKKSSFRYVDKVFNNFTRFIREKLRKHNLHSITFPASLLFNSLFTSDISQPLDGGIKLVNEISIDTNGVFIEDTNFNRYLIHFWNGNASIEPDTDDPIPIWKERIDAKTILHFVSKASDKIANEIQKLEISKEELHKMKAVIKALNSTY